MTAAGAPVKYRYGCSKIQWHLLRCAVVNDGVLVRARVTVQANVGWMDGRMDGWMSGMRSLSNSGPATRGQAMRFIGPRFNGFFRQQNSVSFCAALRSRDCAFLVSNHSPAPAPVTKAVLALWLSESPSRRTPASTFADTTARGSAPLPHARSHGDAAAWSGRIRLHLACILYSATCAVTGQPPFLTVGQRALLRTLVLRRSRAGSALMPSRKSHLSSGCEPFLPIKGSLNERAQSDEPT